MISATTQVTAMHSEPLVARQAVEDLPRVLVVGESPAGTAPLRSMMGDNVRLERVSDLGRALERCLEEPIDVLFVNLFDPRSSTLTALALFRQSRPDQYVAACADESMIRSLEQAGLADVFFILEPLHDSSIIEHPERA